jgi:hypothetical protein
MFIELSLMQDYGAGPDCEDKKIVINSNFITWIWESQEGTVIELIQPIAFFEFEICESITVREPYQEIKSMLIATH